jgi:hypothetical protein
MAGLGTRHQQTLISFARFFAAKKMKDAVILSGANDLLLILFAGA